MRFFISTTEITNLVTSASWSGDTKTAARKLEFTFVQSSSDKNIPKISYDCGYTARFYNGNDLIFRGNIYDFEINRSAQEVKITAFDNLFVANRSKLTRKFEDTTAENIARQVCSEIGLKCGNLAGTGVKVSFISNSDTGFQAIMKAYEEAGKVNGKKYSLIMKDDSLEVVESSKDSGLVIDMLTNLIYKKSIENITNAVTVSEDTGNATGGVISDNDSVNRYSYFLDNYKQEKGKDAQKEARAKLSKPEQTCNLEAVGNFNARAGLKITLKDSQAQGNFLIKSDVHNFKGGVHTMKLELEWL